MKLYGAATSEGELRPGDILSRPSIVGAWHFGVWLGPYLPWMDDFGALLGLAPHQTYGVLEIQKLSKQGAHAEVRRADLETFSQGSDVKVERPGQVFPHEVMARAQNALAAGVLQYAVLGDGVVKLNCEHLARWVATGVSRSLQVDRAKDIGIAASAIVVLILAARLGG